MIFQRFKDQGLAQLSYLIGDGGQCVVIDPARDVEQYLEVIDNNQLQLVAIIETHIHADFACGSHELAARTGAAIHNGSSDQYEYDREVFASGKTLELGELTLKALDTPGHSPEHISILVSGGEGAPQPWGLFTGDTLFAGSVGRVDLAAEETKEDLAAKLYHSIFDTILPLGDDVTIYPGHGSGSACGGGIGDREESTIGYERKNSPSLQVDGKDDFVKKLLNNMPDEPSFYARLKKLNKRGAQVTGGLPWLRAIAPSELDTQGKDAPTLVDGRETAAFTASHIKGALSLPLRSSFATWAGWLLQPDDRILLIADNAEDVYQMQLFLYRLGLDNVVGYLQGGMRGWIEAGLPQSQTGAITAQELHEKLETNGDKLQLVDVRSDAEWQQGHLPGAEHHFAGRIPKEWDELDSHRPTVVYCGSDYRATAAASVLEAHGFQNVSTLLGSFKAWKQNNYETN